MVLNIKGGGVVINVKERDDMFITMELVMKENLKMTNTMAKELITIIMAVNMKEILRMINLMVLV